MDGNFKNICFKIAKYLSVFLLMSFILFPFLWLINNSFKGQEELFGGAPSWIIKDFYLGGYEWIINPGGIMQPLTNSLITAGVTMLMTMIFALTSGYAIAKFKFNGKIAFMGLLFLCQVFQGPLIMIPWYKMGAALGIINTKLILVLIYGTVTIPVAVVMMSGFFKSVPKDLEEAAYIDGCTNWKTLQIIVMPLVKPGVVSVAVLAFINAWNDYQYAYILTSTPTSKTVQILLNDYIQSIGTMNWTGLLAGGVIATLPVVILFAFVQKYLIDGLTAGAVKG